LGDISATDISLGNVTYSLGIVDNTTIVFSWLDASNNTEQIEFWIWNNTNQTQLMFYGVSTNHSSVQFSYILPNVNESYKTRVSISHATFGEETTILDNILIGTSYFLPFVFPLVPLIVGLGGESAVWIMMLVVMPLGVSLSGKDSAISLFFMVLVASVLAYMNVISIATGFVALALFLIVLMEINKRRKLAE